MYSIVVAVEIIIAFILILIFIAQKNKNNLFHISKFEKMLLACLFFTLCDMYVYLVVSCFSTYAGNGIFRLMESLSYIGVYPVAAFTIEYFTSLAEEMSYLKKSILNGFRYILFVFTLVATILAIFKMIATDSVTGVLGEPGSLWILFMITVTTILMIVAIFIIRKEVSGRVFFGMMTSNVMLLSCAVLGSIIPEVSFGYAATGLSIFVVNTFIQTDRLNLNKVKDAKEALKDANKAHLLLTKSYEDLMNEHNTLKAIASIYTTVHLIDLENDTAIEISSDEKIHKLFYEQGDSSAQESIWGVMIKIILPEDKDTILTFTNFSTLEERMKGKNSINTKVRNSFGYELTFTFIRVGDIWEKLSTVIYASQTTNGGM